MFFDDPSDNLHLDSLYPAGCWQVGTPSKPVFTSAWSPGHALVTDTLLPYPDSTTCYAEFTLLATDEAYLGRSILYRQRLDMSPGTTATVEVYEPWSAAWHRYGTSWDEWASDMNGSGLPNDGTGYTWSDTSSIWNEVWLESPCMGVFGAHEGADARWYEPEMRMRFVFTALSNTESRDGWIIDNVRAGVSLCSGGISEEGIPQVTLAPNPASDRLLLGMTGSASPNTFVEVMAADGRIVVPARRIGMDPWIDVSGLPEGPYAVRLNSKWAQVTRTLLVQR